LIYEPFRVRAAVVKDILALNNFSKQVKVIEQDIMKQPVPVPMQLKFPADTLVLDVAAHFSRCVCVVCVCVCVCARACTGVCMSACERAYMYRYMCAPAFENPET